IFNFGFNDGIFIKYGGRDIETLDNKIVREEHSFILIFQILTLILMILYSYLQQNTILILFSITTFFISMNTYHLNFLNAIGEFKLTSKIKFIQSLFHAILLVLTIFILQQRNYKFYIVINILSLVC